MLVASEQSLHFLRESREQHAQGDASARGGERKGELISTPETFAARSCVFSP